VTLARLDPTSLRPRAPRVLVGEYHNAWSRSPDGTQLALGISSPGGEGFPVVGNRGRVGIRIVDVARMRVVRDVSTGVAAEALGWLAPRRLAAVLQSSQVLVVDPVTGRILRRWTVGRLPLLNPGWVRTRQHLVVLLDTHPDPPVDLNPRLAVIDAQGQLQVVSLERQLAGCCGPDSYRAGLAVDVGRRRAFVVAAGVPVAEVDLRTMRVRYHQVITPGAALLPAPGTVGEDALRASRRQALWLGSGALAVAGRQLLPAAGQTVTSTPAGVAIIDTRSWRVRVVSARASRACVVAGRLLAFHGGPFVPRTAEGIGLGVYSLQGRRLLHLFGTQQLSHLQAIGSDVAVASPGAVRVVDLGLGKVVRTLPSRHDHVELLDSPCQA
jgi:hypothetical protein